MPFHVQVVGDDSGTKGTGTHLAIGGLMAPATVWASFTDAWNVCLTEYPRVDYCKLAEAAKRIGPFAGFSEKRRNGKLVALARTIASFPFVALTATINLADQHVDRPEDQQRRKLKKWEKNAGYVTRTLLHPYYEARTYFILAATIHLWRGGVREQFDLIFDEHRSLGKRTTDTYPALRYLLPEDMRSIMPNAQIERDDRTFLPLQAADMIAGLRRIEAEGDTSMSWLGAEFRSLVHSHHSVSADAAWYREMQRRFQEHGPPASLAESLSELSRLLGPVPPDGAITPALVSSFLPWSPFPPERK